MSILSIGSTSAAPCKVWNTISPELQSCHSVIAFKRKLKASLLSKWLNEQLEIFIFAIALYSYYKSLTIYYNFYFYILFIVNQFGRSHLEKLIRDIVLYFFLPAGFSQQLCTKERGRTKGLKIEPTLCTNGEKLIQKE